MKKSQTVSNYVAYTDGSFKPSTNQGGYSSIILENNKIIAKLYQGYINTTNNRCELMGVIETLKFFKNPVKITIYSDSQYVVSSVNNKHVFKGIEDNDLSKKNLDLGFELVDLLSIHDVTLDGVKGHADNEGNVMADLYAQHSSCVLNPIEDIGYSKKYENFKDGK